MYKWKITIHFFWYKMIKIHIKGLICEKIHKMKRSNLIEYKQRSIPIA